MKGIRMAVLGAALILGVTTVASAQEARGGGGGQGRGAGRGGVARLMTDVTVSADVQAKIDSIVAKYQAESRELMTAAQASGGMPDSTTRAKMMEVNNKRNAEVRALLTAEQQVQWDKNVAAMPAGGGRRGGGGGAPPPPPTTPRPHSEQGRSDVRLQAADRSAACLLWGSAVGILNAHFTMRP